jgi:hypothetical protein
MFKNSNIIPQDSLKGKTFEEVEEIIETKTAEISSKKVDKLWQDKQQKEDKKIVKKSRELVSGGEYLAELINKAIASRKSFELKTINTKNKYTNDTAIFAFSDIHE